MATAIELGTDLVRQGAWNGTWGTLGWVLGTSPTNTISLPSGMSFQLGTMIIGAFPSYTVPAAAPQLNGSTSTYLGVWATNGTDFVEIDQTSPFWYTLSAYFVDGDNGGRQQVMEITDTSGSTLSGLFTIANFDAGVWYRWLVNGSIRVLIEQTAGPNAVMSALLIDPPVALLPAPFDLLHPPFRMEPDYLE